MLAAVQEARSGAMASIEAVEARAAAERDAAAAAAAEIDRDHQAELAAAAAAREAALVDAAAAAGADRAALEKEVGGLKRDLAKTTVAMVRDAHPIATTTPRSPHTWPHF